jgi:hypothetical protein
MKTIIKLFSVLVIVLGLILQSGALPAQAQALQAGSVPGKPVLVSPYGYIRTTTPYFRWKPVSGAKTYYIEVQRLVARKIIYTIRTTYKAQYCMSQMCKMTLPNSLQKGAFLRWRVMAINANGYGVPSAWMEFHVRATAQ